MSFTSEKPSLRSTTLPNTNFSQILTDPEFLKDLRNQSEALEAELMSAGVKSNKINFKNLKNKIYLNLDQTPINTNDKPSFFNRFQ